MNHKYIVKGDDDIVLLFAHEDLAVTRLLLEEDNYNNISIEYWVLTDKYEIHTESVSGDDWLYFGERPAEVPIVEVREITGDK